MAETPSSHVYVFAKRGPQRDAVAAIASALQNAHGAAAFRYIDGGYSPPMAHSTEVQCVMLFAHPCETYDGFVLFGPSPFNSRCLLATGWGSSVSARVYAHVCNGSVVLGDPAWSRVIDEWISFRSRIDIWDEEKSTATWARLLNSIAHDVATAVTLTDAVRQVRTLFRSEIMNVSKTFTVSEGRELVKATLQLALDSLTCST